MPCLSQNDLIWLSDHESKIQSLVLVQACCAASSVSYQRAWTCATRASLLSSAESCASLPFVRKKLLSLAASQLEYGCTTKPFQFFSTRSCKSLRSEGRGCGISWSVSHRSSSVSCHLLYASVQEQHVSESHGVIEGHVHTKLSAALHTGFSSGKPGAARHPGGEGNPCDDRVKELHPARPCSAANVVGRSWKCGTGQKKSWQSVSSSCITGNKRSACKVPR